MAVLMCQSCISYNLSSHKAPESGHILHFQEQWENSDRFYFIAKLCTNTALIVSNIDILQCLCSLYA